MTRFWNRIAVLFSLHELVGISGLSRGSVFESLVYRVHNWHKSESGPGLLLPIWVAQTSPDRCKTQPTDKHKYAHIHTCIQTHTCTPTHIHIQVYTYTIYMHTCTLACKHIINTHSPKMLYIFTHTLTPNTQHMN